MLKIYFKQTIALLKQNKLISTISIVGTALAVMMIMVQILVQHINDTSMAPEINRDRMLYLKNECRTSKDSTDQSTSSGTLTYQNYKDYLSDLKTPELISIVLPNFTGVMLKAEGSENVYPSEYFYSDDNYWKIMSFDFVEGKPFDKADYDAGIKKAVLTESKAKQIFGNKSAVGKTITVDFVPYTVTGVIKDVSPIFTFCQGDIFMPHTTLPFSDENKYCYLLILAKDKNDFGSIKEEVRNAERRYNAANKDNNVNFWGPYDQTAQKEQVWTNMGVDEDKISKRFFFILIILLIVPAINLSSFSMSQIKKRTEEIGIRKAFGATQWGVVKQVLIENFITSLIGGIIGLVFSSIILHFLRSWLLTIPDNGSIPVQSFISPSIFVAVFVVCLILNVLSAGIPAIRTVRMNIVDSLNRK